MKLTSSIKDPATFKCADPASTIAKIEEGLERMGLSFRYTGSGASSSLFWGNLSLPSLNYFVEGKGITEELSKASAYGEMAERISAGQAVKYDFMKKFDFSGSVDKLEEYSNFEYLNGYKKGSQEEIENPVTVESILGRYKELSKEDVETVKKSEIASHWVDAYVPGDEKVKVPIKLIHRISGTNGLAAGNTVEEAIVQGANEVFERYACIETLKSGRTVPTMDVEHYDEDIREILRFFEKAGIMITVKDLSWTGFPCVGVLFTDRKTAKNKNPITRTFRSMTFRAASSFSLREALLRCFTERMQGRTADLLKKEPYFDIIWSHFLREEGPYEPPVFFHNVLRKYEYAGDLSFLLEGDLRDPRTYDGVISDNGVVFNDCAEEIEKIDSICRSLNTKLVILDTTHPALRFPAVRVIIPGFSDVLAYTRAGRSGPCVREIVEPSRAERDFEVSDEVFIYELSWMQDEVAQKKLINDIIGYIKTYNTHFIHTFGIFSRSIDAFKLLALLAFRTGLDDLLARCAGILALLHPGGKRYYKRLQLGALVGGKTTPGRGKLTAIMKERKEWVPFLAEKPEKNPLLSWSEEENPEAWEEKYLRDLSALIGSSFT